MPDQDMFTDDSQNQQQTQNSGNPAHSSTNPFEDQLKEIVNENGEQKYRDIQSALAALKASQEFIGTLKGEKSAAETRAQELQAELDKRQSVEDTVGRLLGKQDQGKVDDQNQPRGLDAEAVKQLALSTMKEVRQGEQAESNLNTVVGQMAEWYGDQAKDVIAKRAVELETTPSELEKLARRNPRMALKLLSGAETSKQTPATKSSQSPPRTVNDDNKMPVFEKSLIRGGVKDSELREGWREIQKYTHKRLGVET